MRVISVQDLLTTQLCLVLSCREEAESGRDYCRIHLNPVNPVVAVTRCECGQQFVGTEIRGQGWLQQHLRFCRKGTNVRNVPPTTKKEATSMPAARRSPEEQESLLAAAVQQARDFHATTGRWPLPADIGGDHPLPPRHFGEFVDGGWQRIWDEVDAGTLPLGRAAGNYRANGHAATHAVDPAPVETVDIGGRTGDVVEEHQEPSPPPKSRKRSKPRPSGLNPAARPSEPQKASAATFADLASDYEKAEGRLGVVEAALAEVRKQREEALAALVAHPLFPSIMEEV